MSASIETFPPARAALAPRVQGAGKASLAEVTARLRVRVLALARDSGQFLPPVRTLAAEEGASPATLHKACQTLVAERLLQPYPRSCYAVRKLGRAEHKRRCEAIVQTAVESVAMDALRMGLYAEHYVAVCRRALSTAETRWQAAQIIWARSQSLSQWQVERGWAMLRCGRYGIGLSKPR